MKEEWELETFWNFGLVIKIPNWKHYPLHLYLTNHILLLRMRSTEDVGVSHVVMYDSEPKGMQV